MLAELLLEQYKEVFIEASADPAVATIKTSDANNTKTIEMIVLFAIFISFR
jgi:hypothetical protein